MKTEEKKEIIITIEHFRKAGGTESYMFDLIRSFAQRGIKVHVYADKFDTSLDTYPLIIPHTINLKYIPKPLRIFFFYRFFNKQRLQGVPVITFNYTDNADILICGGNRLGYLNANNNSLDTRQVGCFDKWQINRERAAFKSVRTIVAHSELMKEELIKYYGIAAEKVTILYPPIDTSRFEVLGEEARRTIRARYGWKEEKTVFLFPSIGHKRKGFEVLASFFANTDLPVKLAVAGTPIEQSMRNVESLGFCDNMPELYNAVDYTAMASEYEPFGLVGIESVLCGTPIVFSKNMACREVFNDKAGIFFDRNSPKALRAAIEEAVVRKEKGGARLTKPKECLKYDPTIERHIESLLKYLEKIEVKKIQYEISY